MSIVMAQPLGAKQTRLEKQFSWVQQTFPDFHALKYVLLSQTFDISEP